MAAAGARTGPGLCRLYSTATVAGVEPRRGHDLGRAAGTRRPTAPGAGTDRLLLLFHLGRVHSLEPVPGSAPTAKSVSAGPAADRGGRPHSSRRWPNVP